MGYSPVHSFSFVFSYTPLLCILEGSPNLLSLAFPIGGLYSGTLGIDEICDSPTNDEVPICWGAQI